MSLPILSVIVPVYKTEQYLDACVKSIQAQTLKNLEIILVDDGSPDRCPQMCDEFKNQDSRIKVIHQKNGGLSKARNTGIKDAKGKYITFVDSDDTIEPDTYEGNINFMESHTDVDVVQFPTKRIGWGDQFCHKPGYFRGRRALIINNYKDSPIDNTVCMKIFRREIFDKIMFHEGHVHEDKMFVLQMLQHINVLYISDTGCYNYYRRDNSIQTTDSFNKVCDWIDTEVTTLKCIFDYPETKNDWIGRWMYNVRWLMYQKLKHHEWNVLPLLVKLKTVTPSFSIQTSIKDIFWYFYIKVFGINNFHGFYLIILKYHNSNKL